MSVSFKMPGVLVSRGQITKKKNNKNQEEKENLSNTYMPAALVMLTLVIIMV